MRVSTPPYHWAIVASPSPCDDDNVAHQILYRGSIPAARNAAFVRRLGVKTLICMRKKPLKETDPFSNWASKNGINVVWVKADKMGEETLGMDRDEVTEVLKMSLDPSLYPIYSADIDGNSHTTSVVAALRKSQGWAPDSIEGEVFRFEPDHDDSPLAPFITSYLSTSAPSKDDTTSFCLPDPPYPCWSWPTPPAPIQPAARKDQPTNGPRNERATSSASTSSAGSTAFPFPNPLMARRHPSMRSTFPAVPENSTAKTSRGPPIGVPSSRAITSDRTRTLSPSENQRDRDDSMDSRASQKVSFNDALMGPGPVQDGYPTSRWGGGPEHTSPEDTKRSLDDEEDDGMDIGDEEDDTEEDSGPSLSGSEADEEDEDEDSFEDEEDEDEEEDEEEEEPPVSQYISALDSAGY